MCNTADIYGMYSLEHTSKPVVDMHANTDVLIRVQDLYFRELE